MAAQLAPHHGSRRARGRLSFALVALALTSLALASSARAESRPSYGQSLIASLLEEPLEVDPTQAQTHTEITLASLLFDTLYRLEGDRVEPALASKLPDASDPLKVRISLRAGVRFHNAGVLGPSDVIASLERLRKSSSAYLLGELQSLEVEGNSLVLHLRRPDPDLARRLTDVRSSITSKGRRPTWSRLSGTGPFKLKRRDARSRELRLVAHETHFAGRSYLDELVLRWFEDTKSEARSYETGGSHISLNGKIAFSGHRPKYRTVDLVSEPKVLTYLGFGGLQSITGESEFRHAVSAAVSRTGIKHSSQSPSQIEPSTTVLGTGGKNLAGNRRLAAQLMAALGKRYKEIELGTLKLEIIVNTSRPHDEGYALRVADALFKFGIKTKLTVLDAKSFAQRARKGACDLYIGQLALSAPSDADKIRSAFVAGGQGRALRSLAGKSLGALRKSFAAELPLVPLFHQGIGVHYRSDVQAMAFAPNLRLLFEDLFLFGSPDKN